MGMSNRAGAAIITERLSNRWVLGWGLFISLALILSACGERRAERVLFDGIYFRSKVSAPRNAKQQFEVVVPGVSRSFEGARDAGRYEATKHCVNTFGTSDIIWAQGPDDDPETLVIDRDRLFLTGSCAF